MFVCVANALIDSWETHEIKKSKKKIIGSFDRSVMNLFWARDYQARYFSALRLRLYLINTQPSIFK